MGLIIGAQDKCEITCDGDGCKKSFGPVSGKTEAWKEATKKGWLQSEKTGEYRCPDCRSLPDYHW